MCKRNYGGSPLCNFCNDVETAFHLLIGCPVGKLLLWFLTLTVAPLLSGKLSHGFMLSSLVGIDAICWAICITANRATFDEHSMRSLL